MDGACRASAWSRWGGSRAGWDAWGGGPVPTLPLARPRCAKGHVLPQYWHPVPQAGGGQEQETPRSQVFSPFAGFPRRGKPGLPTGRLPASSSMVAPGEPSSTFLPTSWPGFSCQPLLPVARRSLPRVRGWQWSNSSSCRLPGPALWLQDAARGYQAPHRAGAFPGLHLPLNLGLEKQDVALRSRLLRPCLCTARSTPVPGEHGAGSPVLRPPCLTQPRCRSAATTKPGTSSVLTAEPCK